MAPADDKDVLLGPKRPFWTCPSCDATGNFASRVVCRCGFAAPAWRVAAAKKRAAAAEAAKAKGDGASDSDSTASNRKSQQLAKRVAALEKERDGLQALLVDKDKPASCSDPAEVAELKADIELLSKVKGAEALLLEKQQQLVLKQAAVAATKPVHVQCKEFDIQIAKKLKVVEKLQGQIPELQAKLRDAQQELESEAQALASLRTQKDALLCKALPAANTSAAATQALGLLGQLQTLLTGPSAEPWKKGLAELASQAQALAGQAPPAAAPGSVPAEGAGTGAGVAAGVGATGAGPSQQQQPPQQQQAEALAALTATDLAPGFWEALGLIGDDDAALGEGSIKPGALGDDDDQDIAMGGAATVGARKRAVMRHLTKVSGGRKRG